MKKRYFLFLTAALLLLSAVAAGAQQPRHIIKTRWDSIDKSDIRPGAWRPYPAYRDRAAWDALLDDGLKEQFILAGEKMLDYPWITIKATDYLEFERSGSRTIMESPNSRNRKALNDLMLAELAEGKGRFMDQIINGAWFFAGMPSWVMSAHEYRKDSGRSLPDYRDVIMDLGSQIIANLISYCLYFFGDEMAAVDPSIPEFIYHAIDEKIYKPYLDPSKWRGQSWLGFTRPGEEKPYFWENWDPRNNWNIWCNHAVSHVACMTCRDRDLLLRVLGQAAESVDNYLDFVKMDGACDEGPGYWRHATGSLFEYLDLMNRITGDKFGCFDDPQFVARATYISRCSLGDGWVVNFSDGEPGMKILPCFFYRFALRSGIPEMMDYAIYLQACQKDFNEIRNNIFIYDLLDCLLLRRKMRSDMQAALAAAGGSVEQLRKDMRRNVPAWSWYPQTEHLIVRTPEGLGFAAKGGHNEESHNHNDVGTVILFADEMPVLIDVGPTSYMRQTFNKKERYTIWVMRSEWHNLPQMNGFGQHQGGEYKASGTRADEKKGLFSTQIAGAYPAEAGVRTLLRECRIKGRSLTISDTYELASRQDADEEHFMVRGKVTLLRDGLLRIDYSSRDGSRHGYAELSYPRSLKASVEDVKIDDERVRGIWGDDMRRIILRSAPDAPLKGSYKIKITAK